MTLRSLLTIAAFLIIAGCAGDISKDYTQLRAATVQVTVGDLGNCSGVAVAPNRVLTAAHCDAPDLRVNGLKAVVIKKDEKRDLMVLGVDVSGPYIPLAKTSPKQDTRVVVVGYPMDVRQTITEGLWQGKIKYNALNNLTNVWSSITAAVSPGNSGGPVFAKIHGQWRLVGIVSAVYNLGGMFGSDLQNHLAFVVPVEEIKTFVKSPLQR